MNLHVSGSLSLGLSAMLLLVGCTGDDTSTTGSSATDTDGTDTDTTTNTSPGTTTVSSTGTGTGTDTMSGTGTDSDGTSTTTGTESESATDPTDTDPTTTTDTDGNVCGDGILGDGEMCDDGDMNGTDRSNCNADCTTKVAVCGNGIQEVGEECDDGNTDDGDGCAADCTMEIMNVCGDGMVGDDEECDDGNDVPADGCENDCTMSPPGECGNGEQEWDELCDDGNLVNGDGCEDDCTPTPEPACQMPEDYISCDAVLDKGDALAPFQALGLACSDKVNESILISNTSFNSPDANAWQIAKGFGTYEEMGQLLYSAREGESFILMSSGTVAAPNGEGIITETPGSQTGKGSNGNPDDNAFLPDYTPADDQSGVLQPQWTKGNSNPGDKIWFSFKTQTPGGVKGYAIDFAFFSSEWPSWYDTQYNDLFVAWQVTDDFVGNISTIDGLATTITALNPHWTMDNNPGCPGDTDGPGFSCNEPQLAGTGYEGHAATTWVRINQPVEENKELTLYFFLADMGDTALASGVALDRFRFNCDECIPADDPACMGEVPDPDCCGVVLPQ